MTMTLKTTKHDTDYDGKVQCVLQSLAFRLMADLDPSPESIDFRTREMLLFLTLIG